MMEEEALKTYHGDAMGKAMISIELASKIKEKYAESWITENARRAAALVIFRSRFEPRSEPFRLAG